METFELRYFLAVANGENVRRAAEGLRISPASLSKAIDRLEAELGIALFSREGRNIRLTERGKLLQQRASQIIHIEEATKAEIAGHAGSLTVAISGAEVFLSRYGLEVARSIQQRFSNSRFELRPTDGEDAIRQVAAGTSHLAIVTSAPERGFRAKALGHANFATCVGKRHPLYKRAQSGAAVSVEEVLKHPFVSPSLPILGEMGARQSLDGWRDDKFQRTVKFRTASLKLIEELVCGGEALAYLPDFFAEQIGATALKVSGCAYSCAQDIRLVARARPEIGWINQVM